MGIHFEFFYSAAVFEHFNFIFGVGSVVVEFYFVISCVFVAFVFGYQMSAAGRYPLCSDAACLIGVDELSGKAVAVIANVQIAAAMIARIFLVMFFYLLAPFSLFGVFFVFIITRKD